MMTSLRVALLAIGGLLASPANAVVMVANYQGQLFGGFDWSGFFGNPTGDLSGASYSLSFRYDTQRGTRTSRTGVWEQIIGGVSYGGSNPLIDVAMTINGRTRHFSGSASSSGGAYTSDQYATYGYADDYADAAMAYQHSATITGVGTGAGNFAPLLSQTVAPVPFSLLNDYGSYSFWTYDKAARTYTESSYAKFSTFGTYTVRAVPEPRSWSLLICGFAITGSTLRRRRYMLG